jgi:hypothetical protein
MHFVSELHNFLLYRDSVSVLAFYLSTLQNGSLTVSKEHSHNIQRSH